MEEFFAYYLRISIDDKSLFVVELSNNGYVIEYENKHCYISEKVYKSIISYIYNNLLESDGDINSDFDYEIVGTEFRNSFTKENSDFKVVSKIIDCLKFMFISNYERRYDSIIKYISKVDSVDGWLERLEDEISYSSLYTNYLLEVKRLSIDIDTNEIMNKYRKEIYEIGFENLDFSKYENDVLVCFLDSFSKREQDLPRYTLTMIKKGIIKKILLQMANNLLKNKLV